MIYFSCELKWVEFAIPIPGIPLSEKFQRNAALIELATFKEEVSKTIFCNFDCHASKVNFLDSYGNCLLF